MLTNKKNAPGAKRKTVMKLTAFQSVRRQKIKLLALASGDTYIGCDINGRLVDC